VRGFVLAYSVGTKKFVGCNPCVKKQLAVEVGWSLLTGWFSVTSLLVNPVCILWNTLRLPFVKANPDRVEELMRELGIGVDSVDLARVAASLAATMVAADGKIEAQEVETAISIGSQLIEGFSAPLFQEVMDSVKRLPPTGQLAGLLAPILEEPGKVAVLKYLLAIAAADGSIDDTEIAELQAAAAALGIALPELAA
jgi:uncharacterized tellurite resistance protein B-like protein